MKFFDSHCHLDMEPLKNEIDAVVERAFKADIGYMINVGSSVRGSRESVRIAGLYPNIYAAVGIHPHEAEVLTDFDPAVEELRQLSANDKVKAIGEIGLDFFVPPGEERKLEKDKQKDLFFGQLHLVDELKLPVIIHTRDAEKETLEILKQFPHLKGVVHCFTGSLDFAKKLLDLGYYIGFTGFITFEQPKFDYIREAVKIVPLEKLLIETDAPFLAPEPYRGKPNEPAFVFEVAKKIAEIKGEEIEKVAEITTENAKNLFKIS